MTWFRRRDWAQAQRTIENLRAQEASLVAQLRHLNAENAEAESRVLSGEGQKGCSRCEAAARRLGVQL